MASSNERPYTEDDLTGSNKASLIKLLIPSPHPPKVRRHESAQVIPPKESSPSVASEIASEQPTVAVLPLNLEAPPSNLGNIELLDIRVYLEDSRTVPVQRTAAMLSVPVLDRPNNGTNLARVLCKDLLSALQKSSEIVRISFPDPEDEEWKVPFVRIPHGQSWELSHFDPEALHIPETRRLKLHIDHVPSQLSVSAQSVLKSEPYTSSPGPSIPFSGPTPAQPSQSKEDDTDPAVKFLKDKLSTRDGYVSFTANRGCTLSNPEIVRDWKFAVAFSADYNKLKAPVECSKCLI
ncbi:hypothetical protein B0H14DRAFT_2583092 [Mycena olivaceomarginata]|nr:hypothetical protein B0H14DRAFT_2583092 [Mycena olivaceomarginata]